MLKQLPNALTLLRLILAPVIAWLFWMGTVGAGYPSDTPDGFAESMARYAETTTKFQTLAAIFFIVAALTDFFDGMAARAFDAHSKFGRLIDPIADKALVGLPLVAIWLADMHEGYPTSPHTLIIATAVAVIVLRDVSMTLIRLRSPDGEGVRVSSLAKIKTALELVVVGAFLIAAAIRAHIMSGALEIGDQPIVALLDWFKILELVWLALLVIAAALSAWTAWQYLAPVKKPAA